MPVHDPTTVDFSQIVAAKMRAGVAPPPVFRREVMRSGHTVNVRRTEANNESFACPRCGRTNIVAQVTFGTDCKFCKL